MGVGHKMGGHDGVRGGRGPQSEGLMDPTVRDGAEVNAHSALSKSAVQHCRMALRAAQRESAALSLSVKLDAITMRLRPADNVVAFCHLF